MTSGPDTPATPTDKKSDKKSEQRRAHAARLRAEEKRRERSSRILRLAAIAVAVIVVGGVVTFAVVNGQPASSQRTAPTSGTDTNVITDIPATPAAVARGASTKAPWAAPENASARTALAGLPMLNAEGSVEHIHSHLTITIDGTVADVPADLGIDLAQQRISPLHTHDTTGIIHVEAPVKSTFTLGQLFTEWNVALDATRIGGYTTADGHTITVFVDGTVVTGNPAAIVFANFQNIAIVYSAAGQKAEAPAAFTWPQGY